MPRATRVVTAAERKDAPVTDTLILPHAQRQAQKGFLFGIKGTCVELDFAEPVRLRTDDALVLDDGGLIEVVAEAEPLIEVRAADLPSLARLAWHLGRRAAPTRRRRTAITTMITTITATIIITTITIMGMITSTATATIMTTSTTTTITAIRTITSTAEAAGWIGSKTRSF